MWSFAPLKLFRRTLITDLCFPDFMPEDISFVLRAYLNANIVSVAADYPYYHVAAEQGDSNASVTTWNDVESNLRAYKDIFGLIGERIPEGKDRNVVLKRLFGRDVLNTLVTIGKEQNSDRANKQLETLMQITGPYFSQEIIASFPESNRLILEAAYEEVPFS